jgi:hypothetical protein
MKTKQRTTDLAEKTRPTTIESVKFHDGMIVTAEDLEAAQRYPASLLRTVLRSYLGCGVVCGLGLRVKDRIPHSLAWVVCVDPGVAIDCQGYPIEVCAPVELDLSPDACACESPPDHVCIAVRRITSDESPRDACSCDVDGPHFDCRRTRDNVIVKAFSDADLDALSVCRRAKPAKKQEDPNHPSACGDPGSTDQSVSVSLCNAWTACSPCACGECWVLLGCVTLAKDQGIVKGPDFGDRKWVKPIEVLCSNGTDRIGELEKRVNLNGEDDKKATARIDNLENGLLARIGELENKVKGLTPPSATQASLTTQSQPSRQTSSTVQSPPTTQSPPTA